MGWRTGKSSRGIRGVQRFFNQRHAIGGVSSVFKTLPVVYSRENPLRLKQATKCSPSTVVTAPQSRVQPTFHDENQAISGCTGGFSVATRVGIAADFFALLVGRCQR
jgi:hypothetical protein